MNRKKVRLGGRIGRVVGIAVAALLPVAIGAMTAAGFSSVTDGGDTTTAPRQGDIWLSTTIPTGNGVTLASVRSSIGADVGQAASLTGQGVGIALIDTGVAPVPGLPASQIVNGPDLSFESQSSELRYLDTYGHGTHLAGIMVADDPATGTKGLAPKAKVTSIKIGISNGAVDVSQLIAAIDWVVAHKNDDPAYPIRVLNLAYGSGGNPKPTEDPVQYAAEQAWRAGIVVVAACGNRGQAGAVQLTDPATDPYLLAVGASDSKGTGGLSDDEYALFNNHDYRRPLDVLAPGVSVISLADPGSNVDVSYPGARVGETLFRGSGSSQASAVVSAAVALLVQYRPWLTPDQIKFFIQQARIWPITQQAQHWGIGFLNLNAVIARMNGPSGAQTWSQSSGTGTLEAARGASHVVRDDITLSGENTIFGPLRTSTWAPRSAARTSWQGGVWMGWRFAGDDWGGSSWASRTWAPASWASSPWGGGGSWDDPAWSGRYWSGRYWSSGPWSGRYWSTDDWSAASWG